MNNILLVYYFYVSCLVEAVQDGSTCYYFIEFVLQTDSDI